MQRVGAALGHQAHLSSGAARGIRVGVGGSDTELLHRIQRHAHDAGERFARLLVVVVHAVQGEVALIAAAAIDYAAPVRRHAYTAVDAIGIAYPGDTGLQREHLGYVSALERQLQNGLGAKRIAERGVHGVELSRLGADFNRLRYAAHFFKRHVYRGRRINEKTQILNRDVRKPFFFGAELVETGRHGAERISALPV